MRVLVVGLHAEAVAEVFRMQGHEATPSLTVASRTRTPWDLILYRPDCPALTLSGNRWYGRGGRDHDVRVRQLEEVTADWEMMKGMADFGCALEAPKSVLHRNLGAAVQYIKPHLFGHTEQKEQGLALHRLPALRMTRDVEIEMMQLPVRERQRVWSMLPNVANRSSARAMPFMGVVLAMSQQWGSLRRAL